MNLIDIQIFTLASLTLLLIAHDTFPLGRWNNVGQFGSKLDPGGVFVNAAVGLVPLYLAWVNRHAQKQSSGQLIIAIVLTAVLIGALVSWWILWLLGSSEEWRDKLGSISSGTLTFLPIRHGVNLNSLHCFIHLLTLLGLSESLYMLRR